MSAKAALGLAPHSGWAALVGVGVGILDAGAPRLLIRERIEMAEASNPGSKQPYHAIESLPIEQAASRLAAFEADARRLAHEGLTRVVEALAAEERSVVGVGILESAGRKGSSLEAILASHALIHTADGDHFRNAIADAATRYGLGVKRVRSKDLDERAAAVLGRAPDDLRATLQGLRREAGPPWGADQKAAALLAWLVLKEES